MTATFLAGLSDESLVAWPAHQVDDRGLLLVEHGGGTITTPPGCSIVPGFPLNQGGGSLLSAFDIVATNNAMPALSLAGGSNHMFGVLVRIRDAHPTNPYACFAAMKQSGANVNGAAPGVLVDEDDLALLAVIGIGGDLLGPNSTAEANASLTSVVEVFDGSTQTGDGGGIVVASGIKATPGIVVPWTFTFVSTVFVSAVLGIRPKPIYTVAGNWQIAGSPAPDGTPIDVVDTVTKKIVASTTVTGGAGAYSALVPYSTPNRYRVIGDTGTSFCASAKGTAV